MCLATALTTELSKGYSFYLDILNKKPQRLLWVSQFTQTTAKNSKELGAR